MKKVVFLSRLFYPHAGGVEKHILNLSKELQAKNYKITLITEQHSLDLKPIEAISRINVLRIPVSKNERLKKFNIWKWVYLNRSLILNADVVHAHDVFYWVLPLKLLHPSLKIYTTFHGYEGNKVPKFKEKFMHFIARNLSTCTMSVGRFYKKWYNTKADIITFGAVHKCTNLSQISESKIVKLSYVGRLEQEAGIEDYLKGFRNFVKKIPAHLDVYGEGSRRLNIEKIIKKENLPVTLHGWVNSPEERIINSEIIFTSRYLGILEAMSQGKYIIANYNNEIKKDYLKDTPFTKYISIASSPKEITKKLFRYLENKKLMTKTLREGRIWAESQSWEKLANQYISMWN